MEKKYSLKIEKLLFSILGTENLKYISNSVVLYRTQIQNRTLNPFEPFQKARTLNLFSQKWAKLQKIQTSNPSKTKVGLQKSN